MKFLLLVILFWSVLNYFINPLKTFPSLKMEFEISMNKKIQKMVHGLTAFEIENLPRKNFEIKNIVFVTAFARSQWIEALKSCISLKESDEIAYHFARSELQMVALFLGKLTPRLQRVYHQFCPYVEIKEFNYSKYPAYVENLNHYRWKPLIIAEYLRKNDIVFWFDAAVGFKNGDETLKDIVSSMNTQYKTCGFRIFSKAEYPIVSATDPRMYNYFSANDDVLHLNMISAAVFIVSKTPEAVKVLERVVQCALIEDCMGPPNSTNYCNPEKLIEEKYSDCHKYDQSALALSLAQCSLNIRDYFGNSDMVLVGKTIFQKIRKENPVQIKSTEDYKGDIIEDQEV
ncbi:hypothetical protein FO519_009924 [Halicephalobus sp. NKZ332]|nr:hypothetical protein FO519_009924 [Halicephalobus sp. NKZ332]